MEFFFDYNSDDMEAELSFEAPADIFVATLQDFRQTIKSINTLAKDEASYLFKKLEGDHWMLQEDVHSDDEYDCAVFKVISGEVYAISDDVMKFWKKLKKKFDI